MTYVDKALRVRRKHNGPAWARAHLWRGCEAPGCDVNPGVLTSRLEAVKVAANRVSRSDWPYVILRPLFAQQWLRRQGFNPSLPLGVADHIVPIWEGGADGESNLQLLCQPCHREKTSGEARRRARAPKHRHQIGA